MKENQGTHRSKSESVLLLAHSRIFFFSQPSTVLTHSSPGLRQSFEMNGISPTSEREREKDQSKCTVWSS